MKRRNTSPTIRQAFTEFIDEKKSTGLSQPTIHNYIQSLQVMLADNGWDDLSPVAVISKESMVRWSNEMLEQGCRSRQSINHYLRDIRCFTYWCIEQEYLEYFKFKMIKAGEESIERYTEEEIKSLLAPPSLADDFPTWRTWAVVSLIMGTGARIGSVCNITKDSISTNTITLAKTKQKKVQVLPLSPKLKQVLERYQRVWYIDTDWLFPSSKRGTQLTPHCFSQALEAFCEARGVTYRGVHTLRHTFAYMCFKSGMSITEISYYLGHSTYELTRHYVGKLSEKDVSTSSIPLEKITDNKSKIIRRK